MRYRICANCLLPIHENEMGLRHRGGNTLHSESRCIDLLEQKIDFLKRDICILVQQRDNALAELAELKEAAPPQAEPTMFDAQFAAPCHVQGASNRQSVPDALAAAPQAEPVRCVSVDTLSRMVESVDGLDCNARGYLWRKGWNDALRLAMDYASAAPPPAAPQWVSCAERLPEAGVEVLVAVGPSVYLAEREDGEWWAVDRMPSALGGVTHWMPLPAAPRSEG